MEVLKVMKRRCRDIVLRNLIPVTFMMSPTKVSGPNILSNAITSSLVIGQFGSKLWSTTSSRVLTLGFQ
eukprot:10885092-Ditylum_brightwellii.AAC.2